MISRAVRAASADGNTAAIAALPSKTGRTSSNAAAGVRTMSGRAEP
ncbi:hypothetical protein PV396_28450 [Streptomyces sp. ME02-8801-2C]|nr:hypothetical protein [Streptomyces sp. ME02-8801-2C]MDX3455822.1 hypothetical protein [Streptomyces sp. ME02-8801-2C]